MIPLAASTFQSISLFLFLTWSYRTCPFGHLLKQHHCKSRKRAGRMQRNSLKRWTSRRSWKQRTEMVVRPLFSTSISNVNLSQASSRTDCPRKIQQVQMQGPPATPGLAVHLVIHPSDSVSTSSIYSDQRRNSHHFSRHPTQTPSSYISRLSYDRSLHHMPSPKNWCWRQTDASSSWTPS